MIIHRQDDTFVIDYNGNPYHLTPEAEPSAGMYADTLAQYKTNPAEFTEEYPPEPPTYTAAECYTKAEALIDKRLNDFASELYSDLISAVTYGVASSDPVYRMEGQYCADMRDLTWNTAQEIYNTMMSQPGAADKAYTEDEFNAIWSQIEAQLPVLAWPEGSRGYKG